MWGVTWVSSALGVQGWTPRPAGERMQAECNWRSSPKGVPLWEQKQCCQCSQQLLKIWIFFSFVTIFSDWWSSPGGTNAKEPTCHCRRHKRCKFDPRAGKIPWRRTRQLTLVFLPEKSHGQRNLMGHSLWGHRESDMTEATRTW